MPVFNKMVYNWTEYILWWWGNIWEPLNLTVTTSGLDATITWEDNEIWTIPPTTFQKSELVRKIGSAPTSPSDWVLVVTETVKDTYKVSGYVDQWLTDWETYYYRVFSYSDLGGISYCDAVNVTPSAWWWQPWANTLVYLTLDWDSTDSSWNSRDGTLLSGSWTYSWEYINGVSGSQYFSVSTTNTDGYWFYWDYANSAIWSGDRTISVWYKTDNTSDGSPRWMGSQNGWTQWEWFGLFWYWWAAWVLRYYDDPLTWTLSIDSWWHHYVETYDNTNKSKLYIDGVLQTFAQHASSSFNTLSNRYQLWALRIGSGTWTLNYWFSAFIIEDQVRDATMVSDYYNATKWDYWIS